MRRAPLALSVLLLLSPVAPAFAQLSINYGEPGVSIGIQLGGYPTLQRIPGYPVYYAPGVATNYFFYDGLYWVYNDDNWYASSWYNGPWRPVDRFDVPVYLLRVPVRYYRHPPAYFRGWRADAAPRWGDHWGREWDERRGGWNQWNRKSAPAPAPLPSYQRQYSGNRYPDQSRQGDIQHRSYNYQPREQVTRQHYEQQRGEQAQPRQHYEQQRGQAQPRQQAAPQRAQEQPHGQARENRPAENRPAENRRQDKPGVSNETPAQMQRDRERQGGGG